MFLIRGRPGSRPAHGITRPAATARQTLNRPSCRCDEHRHPEGDVSGFRRPKGAGSPRVFLIGSPVIRICAKPPRISGLNFSNRHKNASLWGAVARHRLSIIVAHTRTAGQRACDPPLLSFLVTYLSPLATATPMIFLIGPPVIRIFPKPFKIRHNFNSNRRKSTSLQISLFRPYGNLYFSAKIPKSGMRPKPVIPQPLNPPLLIGSSAIRIRRNPRQINHLHFSNRHKTARSNAGLQAHESRTTNHEVRLSGGFTPRTLCVTILVPRQLLNRSMDPVKPYVQGFPEDLEWQLRKSESWAVA